MTRRRMHADQVDTSPALVQRLLAEQFPEWASLPINVVQSWGTDHDLYRLGSRLVVRMPIVAWATEQAAKERVWLPTLAPQLPLAVPVPVAHGVPAEGFPYEWSVYQWLPGQNAAETVSDLNDAAGTLACFVKALHNVPTTGAHPRPGGARGGRLAEGDQQVRASIDLLPQHTDVALVRQRWEESLVATPRTGAEVWIHGDLLPGNLLVVDRQLSAVIDFAGLNVGDPACDLLPAWNLFTGDSRTRFRRQLGVDDATWLRGRGWALAQAVNALPYYRNTNPGIVRQASYALNQILSDPSP